MRVSKWVQMERFANGHEGTRMEESVIHNMTLCDGICEVRSRAEAAAKGRDPQVRREASVTTEDSNWILRYAQNDRKARTASARCE